MIFTSDNTFLLKTFLASNFSRLMGVDPSGMPLDPKAFTFEKVQPWGGLGCGHGHGPGVKGKKGRFRSNNVWIPEYIKGRNGWTMFFWKKIWWSLLNYPTVFGYVSILLAHQWKDSQIFFRILDYQAFAASAFSWFHLYWALWTPFRLRFIA